jgi:hypothetical protein
MGLLQWLSSEWPKENLYIATTSIPKLKHDMHILLYVLLIAIEQLPVVLNMSAGSQKVMDHFRLLVTMVFGPSLLRSNGLKM